MTMAFRELDQRDDRVLCALRCIDATSRVPVESRLRIRSITPPHPRIQRNSRGLFVVVEWASLAEHARAFLEPPAQPSVESLSLKLAIEDPSGCYLPRLVEVLLPRNPDPLAARNLFEPIEVPLYSSATAPLEANWSVLNVSVHTAAEALGGALLLVSRNGSVLASGLSDWRGEALVAIAGVPIISFSDQQDAALTHDLDVVLEGVFNPGTGTRIPLAKVRDGPPPALLPLVDPEALHKERNQMPRQQRNLRIAARGQISTTLRIDIPE
jgi:hypothetical protein